MRTVPKKIVADYVEISGGVYGYVLKMPEGFDVLDTKITRDERYPVIVGIRLKEKA